MIIDPDFLDHWRTGMVVDALGDASAPLCILRLWAHCQERKSDTFAIPTRGLKAQCKWAGDADAFERALIEAGFLERAGDVVTVLGWAEKNASLLAAWGNGAKGGRPKKNPDESHWKPTGNPNETKFEPIANPGETDKRREEKSGEEEKTATSIEVARARRTDEPQLTLVEGGQEKPWSSPQCPHLEVLALWAEVLPALPQHEPSQWKGSRADHLRARWRETAEDKRWPDQAAGLAYFRKLFAYVGKSPFLTGRAPTREGKRPFFVELEWLVKPMSWAKLIEGKYHSEAA